MLLAGWLAVIVAGAWGVGLLSGLGPASATLPWDRPVLHWFLDHRTSTVTPVVRAVTWLGSGAVLFPVVAAVGLVWYWRRGSTRALVVGVLAYVGASAAYNSAKWLIASPRPDVEFALVEPAGYAYPSGHALGVTAVSLALALVAAWSGRRRVLHGAIVTAGVVVGAVAVSRLYLAVHWMTDVVAGVALGALWTLGLTSVLAALWGPSADRREAEVPTVGRGNDAEADGGRGTGRAP